MIHSYDPPAGLNVCMGFPIWKRPHVRPYFRSLAAARETYIENPWKAVQCAKSHKGRILIWASSEREELTTLAREAGIEIVRIEDGFLRSVGLGSEFHAPYSLVFDRKGIYYDSSRPSQLEQALGKGGFDQSTLSQARYLRHEIIRRQITKYNLEGGVSEDLKLPSNKCIVLVPGQVENDASVRKGSSDIRANLQLLEAVRTARPEAFILYKPHPDVAAENRPGRIAKRTALLYCDSFIEDTSLGALLNIVDEVHTISSLTGFEALLRGKAVFTYGGPFYAGWGLTTDHLHFPRRTRKVSLDELVAATLITYPLYYDWKTKMFCGPELILDRLSSEGSGRHGSESWIPKLFSRAFRIWLQPYIK